MACYADKVIETAIGEIGYKETGENHTKYAEYIDQNLPGFYNGEKSWPGGGAEWCDLFVDYCVLRNSSDEAEAEYVLCQPKKSAGAGCKESYDYYKKAGRTGSEPRLGAQIYFGSDKPKHTGLVVNITADSVITVEGNTDDQVKKHTYKKTSSKIYGYGYPRYAEEAAAEPDPEPTPVPAPEPEPSRKTTEEIAREVIAGKWGNNPERRKRLEEAGYDYQEIQDKVNELLGISKPAETAAIYHVKTNSGLPLRLRQEPNINSKKLELIPNGTVIQATETRNGWAKTTYNGKTGWCSMTRLV